MGHPDQFAKETFIEETPVITGGAATFEVPPEMAAFEARGDGLIFVRDAIRVSALSHPWPEAAEHKEVFVEIKMPGDHLDVRAVQRALMRRQIRQVQRVEKWDRDWLGEEPLWVVAPSVPAVLTKMRPLEQIAPGCHRVGNSAFSFLWIAANDLPLAEELIPFLMARSGRSFVDFARWAVQRRPPAWLTRVLQYISMTPSIREELLRYVAVTDDPDILSRQEHMARVFLDLYPKVREEVQTDARIAEVRAILRRTFARRNLPLTPEDEAKIDACSDLATLERWHDEAVVAASAADALI